ncbi:UDP-N-acetylmuramoyl-tripeptide--D-alanyl-D-alanine ligase [Serratia symbiotica]|uniref:UDP-N-acetylmuramoyl-tripeptide--D-alanyl-D- alanine ligase n=1 Tax=Serratia symbiotica TaxID=138074 RepID=UPI0030D5CF1D|nr:UDP-N-acetylmuramoyl-tripeptide--D-alanyl-D-alanine ligase [Serratia symbiotica]
MIPVSLLVLAEILSAELIGADSQIIEVKTDTRKVTTGCLFVALKGEHFDAHDCADAAVAAGAGALLVSQRLALDAPQLVVADTRLALGQLAAWVRQQVPVRLVAMTGSSGKTSVKEMTTAILSECGEVLYTAGNFNNDIGVPLTLLRLQPQHDFAVIELGANHIGEIAYTSALARPQAALINNLAAAHLEGFGSLEGVAQAKGEIFTGLPADGVAIINADNNDWPHWQSMLSGKTVRCFSPQASAGVEFFASEVRGDGNGTQFQLHSPFGSAEIVLPLPGRHNVANALAAAALAMSVGASLKSVRQGLSQLQAVPGRMFPIVLAANKLLLDDSYNANVGSMTTAAQVLAEMPGYRVMVVGDMDELGAEAKEYHRQVGEATRRAGIEKVISVGGLSRVLSMASGNGEHYQDKTAVIARVAELLVEHEVITVLIKGSHRASMQHVVCALQEKTPC